MAAVRGSFCCGRDMLFSQSGNLFRRQILPITRSFSRCTKNSQRAKFVVSRSSCGYLRRTYSTAAEPIPPPTPDGAPKEYPPKIKNIVDEISKLTLLEVTNLNELLKTTLKIQDAPMMQMSAMPAQAAEAKEEEAPKEEQTEFMVTLTKFDESAKVKLIKEIKNLLPEMNLVQAKKFVESTPQKIRDKVSKEEAEKIKKQVEAAGGSVEIE